MREHERDAGSVPAGPVDGKVPGTSCPGDRKRASSVVFDLSAMESMNVKDLSLLLTARQLAHGENREVWMTGLPARTWQILQAMGIAHLFARFPDRQDGNDA